MNWTDIERSLDLEFKRLEDERERNMKDDEKLADFLVRKFEESLQDSENLKTITFDTESEVHKRLRETCSSCDGLRYHPPFTFDQNQDTPITCGKCNNHNEPKLVKVVTGRTYGDHKQLVTVVKGSSVTEFKQNWKEKVEAN